MLKKLLPIVLLLAGSGAGIGAGLFLRPEGDSVEATEASAKQVEIEKAGSETSIDKDEAGLPTSEYVKMNNQFVIPIVSENDVAALVVLSISIEVTAGQKDTVYQHEPKLRDSFLQELFNHANRGGFDGEFTSLTKMSDLRNALWEVATATLGDLVKDVLILELARQDF